MSFAEIDWIFGHGELPFMMIMVLLALAFSWGTSHAGCWRGPMAWSQVSNWECVDRYSHDITPARKDS